MIIKLYRTFLLFLALIIISIPFVASNPVKADAAYIVTAYLSEWTMAKMGDTIAARIDTIDWTKVDYLYVPQIRVTSASDPTLTSGYGISQYLTWTNQVKAEIAAQGASTKVLISLYNPGDGKLSAIVADSTKRTQLATNIHNFLITYGFDGVDVDWEEIAGYGAPTESLIVSLYNQLSPHNLIITLAAAPTTTNCDYADVGSYLDYINIMAYDIVNPAHSTYTQATNALTVWTTAGYPKSKLLLGIPAYAKDNNGIVALWSDVVRELNPTDNEVSEALASIYTTWGGTHTVDGGVIWYGGIDLCEQKSQYIYDNDFAGTMIFDIGEDEWSDPAKSFTITSYNILHPTGVSIPAAPTNVAATDGTSTAGITITWTKSTNATGYNVYRNSSLIATLGDVATYSDNNATYATITPGSAIATDGTYEDKIVLSISGAVANNGESCTYFIRATNITGESSNSNTDTGYRGIGALSYQWYRSAADSNVTYAILSGATTTPYNETSIAAGIGRYYKCQLTASGSVSQYTTANRGYRLNPETPTPTPTVPEDTTPSGNSFFAAIIPISITGITIFLIGGIALSGRFSAAQIVGGLVAAVVCGAITLGVTLLLMNFF